MGPSDNFFNLFIIVLLNSKYYKKCKRLLTALRAAANKNAYWDSTLAWDSPVAVTKAAPSSVPCDGTWRNVLKITLGHYTKHTDRRGWFECVLSKKKKNTQLTGYSCFFGAGTRLWGPGFEPMCYGFSCNRTANTKYIWGNLWDTLQVINPTIWPTLQWWQYTTKKNPANYEGQSVGTVVDGRWSVARRTWVLVTFHGSYCVRKPMRGVQW